MSTEIETECSKLKDYNLTDSVRVGSAGRPDTSLESENRLPHNCDHNIDPSSGHNLGRDDPLWPLYVQEAEKWDNILMQKWNR